MRPRDVERARWPAFLAFPQGNQGDEAEDPERVSTQAVHRNPRSAEARLASRYLRSLTSKPNEPKRHLEDPARSARTNVSLLLTAAPLLAEAGPDVAKVAERELWPRWANSDLTSWNWRPISMRRPAALRMSASASTSCGR